MDRSDVITTTDDPTAPLLVKATHRQKATVADTREVFEDVEEIQDDDSASFMDNLQGSINLTIPRNTWIKSPNMRIEIEGDLKIEKPDADFEIFGIIAVVRGHYDLIGKRFKIEQGFLRFKGGKEFNPEISLVAVYHVRVGREKQKLTLKVGGELNQPTFNFTLDGQQITEANAISYVVFGRSIDNLSYGQQSEISGSAGKSSLLTDVAIGALNKELSEAIGKSLNLDYLEIKSEDSWQTAVFMVGKYITNDLFVSYEREIGTGGDNDIAKETISVEYELTKNILLHLVQGDAKARGFDLMFKFER
jgi:autotransporter translocation and assembly factor TamB